MIEKLKALHEKLHEQGIRLWFIRDPIKNTPSVSLTMLVLSFLFYFLTLINKLGKWFSDVDGSFQVLTLAAALYFGRSFSSSGKGKPVSTSDTSDKKE